MKKNTSSEDNLEPVPQNFWKRNQRSIYIASAVVVFLLLLIFGKDFFRSEKFFTQYHKLSHDAADSLGAHREENKMVDSTGRLIEPSIIENPKDSTNAGIFSVNTHYDKITKTTIPNKLSGVEPEGLFEKLLVPEDENQEFENFYKTYRHQNILSSESLLKVLAITGRSILIEHNDADDQLLMQVLTESEKVNGIIIANEMGHVVYATNRKYLNTLIASILPEIDLTKLKISWYQKGNENIVTIPIFHTYGKIGTAVLITQV